MLFLLFHLDRDCYALEAARIEAVIPLVHTKRLPRAPLAIAGLIEYGGTALPLVDLSQLALGRGARRTMSTRIALTHYRDRRGAQRLLGLLLERATDTFRCAPGDFRPSAVGNAQARYLGPVAHGPNGLVQWVAVDELLTPSLADLLFDQPVDA